MGIVARRRPLRARRSIGPGAARNSLSATDAAVAVLRIDLEVDLVDRRCAPAVVGASGDGCEDIGDGPRLLDGRDFSDRDSVAVCNRELCEAAWGSLAVGE